MYDTIIRWGGLASALGAVIALIFKGRDAWKIHQEKRNQFQNEVLKNLKELHQSLDDVKITITGLQDDNAHLQANELKHAYNSYMRLGYCPVEDKSRILELYDDYHGKGRNSLADGFAEDIKKLPISQQEIGMDIKY